MKILIKIHKLSFPKPLVTLLVGLFTLNSLAAAPVANSGAVSSATAGAGRASVEASDSPFLNPATLPYLRGYFLTSSYNRSSSDSSDLSFSVIDNMRETLIPTALGYIQSTNKSDPEMPIRTQDLRLALGEKYTRKFSAGMAIHHRNDRSERALSRMETYSQTNLVLATAWAATDNLSFGFVGDDLFPPAQGIPSDLRLTPRVSMGMAYNFKKMVRTKLDYISGANNTYARPSIVGGVESYMNHWMIIRIGLGRDFESSSNIFSGGLGFQGPKFGIHYAYLQNQREQNLIRHSVDLAIPVW
jgi:hypothetical protein